MEIVKYETWTIADFLECDNSPVFHGHKWFAEKLQADVNAKEKMDIVKVQNIHLYRFHDGQIFEKLNYIQINGKDIINDRIILERQLRELAVKKEKLISDFEEAQSFFEKTETQRNKYLEFLQTLKLPPQAKKEIGNYANWCQVVVSSFEADSGEIDKMIVSVTKQIQELIPVPSKSHGN